MYSYASFAAKCFALGVSVILLSAALPANAAIQCYECHGTKATGDYRPVDSAYRNISTGGFAGNHQSHMSGPASADICAKCHPGSSDYTTGHRDGLIQLSPKINGSQLVTTYRNATTATPQTATPTMGSCANINCHFERETDTWGADYFNSDAACAKCHGSPPGGTSPAFSGGVAGSHAKHDLYFTGPAQCSKCHVDHKLEANPFSHATSVVRRPLSVELHNPDNTAGGTYNGPLDDFLPSQSNSFGSCSNNYCHSAGNSATVFTPKSIPTWGDSLPADCSGCHGADYNSAVKIDTGSHSTHSGRAFYAQYIFDCNTCHSATAANSREIANRTNHVNQKIDVVMNSKFGGTYSTNGHLPGEAAGSCANVYCHSNVQGQTNGVGGPTYYAVPVWGSTVGCGNCHAGDGGHGHGGIKMATGSHTKHLAYAFTTVNSNTVKCMICHKYTDQPFVPSCFGNPYGNTVCHWGAAAKHSNGVVDVRIDPTFGNMSAYIGSSLPGDGYSTCSSTYCHSNGTSLASGTIPSNTTTVWGSGTLSCAACHGNPPSYANNAPKKNSHDIHNTYGYGCNRCHYATTTDGTTISNTTNHVNLAYNIAASPGTFINYSFARTGGTCTSNSCHNDGTGIVTGSLVATRATWGVPLPRDAFECYGCHNGRPKYTSGSPKGNSHQIYPHVAYECSRCHGTSTSEYDISDPSKHVNGVYDVASSYSGLFSYTFSPTGGGCNATYCHGSPGYYKWGGIACSDCHEAAPDPSTHRKHAGITPTSVVYGDLGFTQYSSTSGTVNYYGCGNCHTRDIGNHPNIRSGFSVVQLYDATAPAGSIKALNPSTAIYKGPGSISSTVGYDSRGHRYFNGSCNNIYCHSSAIWPSQGMPQVFARSYKELKWNAVLPAGCTGCHGYPPLPGGSGQINGHSSHTAIGCNICHFSVTRDGQTITANGTHVNGIFDVVSNGSVSFTYTYNKLGSSCANVSCHSVEPKNTNWGGVAMEPAMFSPAPAAAGVPISSTITVTFAEDMDPSTLTTGTFQLDGGVTGTVSYDAGTHTAVFTPSGPLASLTIYSATITTGVRNQIGKALPRSYTWSFTTGN